MPGQFPAVAAPAAKKHDRKRLLLISTAVVAVITVVTIGVWALLPGRTGNSVVAAVTCKPADLAGCLIKAPAGAVRLAGTNANVWPQQTAVVADLYSSNITKDAKGVYPDTASKLSVDGVTSRPMGMFPLTAPRPPAASQGACPSATDCLMPAPRGTTDTTSTSYQAGASVDAGVYAAQYDIDSSTGVATWLDSGGLTGARHRAWTAGNGVTADAVLLKYEKPEQARAAAELEYGFNAADDRICTDPAVPDSICLAAPVSAGDYRQKETIRVLAWKGDYAVSVAVTVSNSADVADAYAWAQQQLNLLPAA